MLRVGTPWHPLVALGHRWTRPPVPSQIREFANSILETSKSGVCLTLSRYIEALAKLRVPRKGTLALFRPSTARDCYAHAGVVSTNEHKCRRDACVCCCKCGPTAILQSPQHPSNGTDVIRRTNSRIRYRVDRRERAAFVGAARHARTFSGTEGLAAEMTSP